MVHENKTCRKGNNWIGSSFVDVNFEDWTDRYRWQPLISEVTDYITCRRLVLPAPRSRPSVIFRKTRQRNNLNGKKLPSRKYQQRFINSFLWEEGSGDIDLIVAASTTRSLLQQLLHTIVNWLKFSTLYGTYPVVSYVQRSSWHC